MAARHADEGFAVVKAVSGFGANGLCKAPVTIGDELVEAAFRAEVMSTAFRGKLIIHNMLTLPWKWVTPQMVLDRMKNAQFGIGNFTVKAMDDGTLLFGGRQIRTFWNRQFFHHELIHVSQILKNPKLRSDPGWRMVHEGIQPFTAHGTEVDPGFRTTG